MREMASCAFLKILRVRPGWGSIPVVVPTVRDVDGADRRRLVGRADKVFRKGQAGLDDVPPLLRSVVGPAAA